MRFSSIDDFKKHLSFLSLSESKTFLVATSGGFDPLHVGHLRCIQGTVKIAKELQKATLRKTKVVVIVNDDDFLLRKKNYAFMNLEERMEIVDGIEGVDYVVPWSSDDQTVTGALKAISPIVFTKGGDRTSSENVPEFEACERMNCAVIFNVGGGKIQSSSELVAKMKESKNENN
jgi:D-beta-D-heptose 7-phosphate kinase/D-beta-D-heptose 1-phosphate adenosyltransferase